MVVVKESSLSLMRLRKKLRIDGEIVRVIIVCEVPELCSP